MVTSNLFSISEFFDSIPKKLFKNRVYIKLIPTQNNAQTLRTFFYCF